MKTATMAAAVLLLAGVGLALPAPGRLVLVPRWHGSQTDISPDNLRRDFTADPQGLLVVDDGRGTLPGEGVVPVASATWSLLKRLYRG